MDNDNSKQKLVTTNEQVRQNINGNFVWCDISQLQTKLARCQRLPPIQDAVSHTTDFKISQNLALTAANGATLPESVATQFAGGFTYLYESGTDEQ
jgi:hypothetical protein